MDLIDALNWRYATKRMIKKPVEDKKVEQIIEAVRLSPSSLGLHPYHLILITDKKLKEKIKPVAYDQAQIVEASHILIFAGWDNYTEERINNYINMSDKIRELPKGFSDPYREKLKKSLLQKDEHNNFEHISRQAYIGLGVAIAAAATLHVDSIPMEGFKNEVLDELLGLKKMHLKSLVILPLGYRDEKEDYNFKWKKVRPYKDDFVIRISDIQE